MQPPILPITTSSNSNRPTSILPFLDVTKSLIGVCFSSLLTVFTFMKQNHIATGSTPPWSFSVLCVALSFAFSASVCEVLIRTWFPSAAGAMERVALVSIVTAFFTLMVFILPEDLGWFLLIPFLLVLVPFLHSILRGIIIKYHASSTRRSFVPTGSATTDEESTLPREAVAAERVTNSAPISRPSPTYLRDPSWMVSGPNSWKPASSFSKPAKKRKRIPNALETKHKCLETRESLCLSPISTLLRSNLHPDPEKGRPHLHGRTIDLTDKSSLHRGTAQLSITPIQGREKKPKNGSTCNIGSQALPPSSVSQPASQPNCLPPPLSRNLQRNQAASL